MPPDLHELRDKAQLLLDELLKNEYAGLSGKVEVMHARTTGVQGDFGTYGHIAVVVMDSPEAAYDFKLLEKISSIIVNNVAGINRVVYDITQK